VVYAGAAGMVLEPTSDPAKIRAALDRLSAGGSTAGGAGLELAYRIARDNFIEGGVNRILLATDGDFNVGVSDTKALIAMVERRARQRHHPDHAGLRAGQLQRSDDGTDRRSRKRQLRLHRQRAGRRKVLGDQMSCDLFTIAKDVKIQVEFNPAQVSQYRLLGYENRRCAKRISTTTGSMPAISARAIR
jgi:Ca-activated chloride channel family protein